MFGQESIAHFILVCNIKKYLGCHPFYRPAEIIEFRQHIIVFRLHQTLLFHYVYGERNSDGANSFSVVKGVYLQNPGMHSKHVILNWYFKTLVQIVLCNSYEFMYVYIRFSILLQWLPALNFPKEHPGSY